MKDAELHCLLLGPRCSLAADTTARVRRRTQAQVAFTLGDVLHTVHGTFALKRGNLRFDPETGKASGEIVVDAASGESGSAARDKRMHANILESARYPEIVFRPDRVEGKSRREGASDVRAARHVHAFTAAITRCRLPLHVRGRRRTVYRHCALRSSLCEMGHEESQHADSASLRQSRDRGSRRGGAAWLSAIAPLLRDSPVVNVCNFSVIDPVPSLYG